MTTETRMRAAICRVKRGDAVILQIMVTMMEPLSFVSLDFGCGETVWSSHDEMSDIVGPVTIEIAPA